ncbi:hypothetical protein O6H91_03G118100 [Diphasiastrum complanatum]|uniref:Uncharacterized protein n=1 Tax=Diphasiastrum complanatum TaxID=34168 RepID=A0ACC2EAX2_DIPCM|nr:hypothetical protein O6H91_03G118100 [Diphasiastrum complanatum]
MECATAAAHSLAPPCGCIALHPSFSSSSSSCCCFSSCSCSAPKCQGHRWASKFSAVAMRATRRHHSFSSSRSNLGLQLLLYSRSCAVLAPGRFVKYTFAYNLSEQEQEEASEKTGLFKPRSEQIPIGNGNGFDKLPPTGFPARYKLILTASLAFVVCNMDKVNMSVAIIPMSQQLGWSPTTAGVVQSSFFWGYALSQLPGGWLSKNFDGQKVLRAGVFVWSLATAMVPLVASSLPLLLFCRLLVGLGEGVSPSAVTDLIARNVPATERSRAVAFVFGGLSIGTITGLLIAPPCIENYGWESVFYIFGCIGILWCVGFDITSRELKSSGNGFDNNFTTIEAGVKGAPRNVQVSRSFESIPWKAFFKSEAVWAMIYAHFCGNWGHYTLLAWLPTYFSDELHLDLTNAALVSIFPPLASTVVSSIASSLADTLISQGVDITLVRKLCQSMAFLAPSICMALASLGVHLSSWEIVLLLTVGIGLSSFSLAGLYCTHQDISPKYASMLLGITSTFGAVPGILGVALVGYIYEQTNSWNILSNVCSNRDLNHESWFKPAYSIAACFVCPVNIFQFNRSSYMGCFCQQ